MKNLMEKDIQDALAGLIGQKVDYDAFSAQSALRRFFANFDGDGRSACISINKDGAWRFLIAYRGYLIGSVDVKRKKGAGHYGILGGHYNDWTYKQFSIWLWSKDDGTPAVEERLDEIDGLVKQKTEAEESKKETARRILKLIAEELNVSEDGAKDFVSYMNSKRYSL